MKALATALQGESSLLRLLLLSGLSLLLLLPLDAVRDLVAEREQTRDQVQADVAAGWGRTQALAGPFLVLPYRTRQTVQREGREVVVEGREHLVLLPESLAVEARQRSEQRQRGLFRVPVFTASATLAGRFDPVALDTAGIPAGDLLWPQAEMLLMLSDLRALSGGVHARAAGQPLQFRPGGGQRFIAGLPPADTVGDCCVGGVVHAPWPLAPGGAPLDFELALSFNGTAALMFAPVGRDSRVRLVGDWPTPSFAGAWLPQTREVDSSGYRAQWEVGDLARSFGQVWSGAALPLAEVQRALFGVRLISPLDPYALAGRALKYAQLFVVMSFALWWFFEQAGGQRVPALQYLLAGGGLCLFYLLQLALAEHLGFATAYGLAAAAVTAQITLYSWSILRALRRAAATGAATASLYAYLFTVLSEERYALLGGALGLFLMLSLLMWQTRKPAATAATCNR